MVAKCFGSFSLLLLCHLWWEMIIVVFVRGEHRKKFKNKTLQYPLEKAHSSRGVPPLGRVKVVKYQNLFPHLPSQTHTHTHTCQRSAFLMIWLIVVLGSSHIRTSNTFKVIEIETITFPSSYLYGDERLGYWADTHTHTHNLTVACWTHPNVLHSAEPSELILNDHVTLPLSVSGVTVHTKWRYTHIHTNFSHIHSHSHMCASWFPCRWTDLRCVSLLNACGFTLTQSSV